MKIIASGWSDYVPLLSTIRGCYRIYIAANCNSKDEAIRDLAVEIFKKDIKTSDYSRWVEIVRGGVSLVPVVNLILIPWDLGFGLVMIVYHRLNPPTRLQKLKTLELAISRLHSFYLLDEEHLKENRGKNTTLPMSSYDKFKFRQTLKSAFESMKAFGGYSTPNYDRVAEFKQRLVRSMGFDRKVYFQALAFLHQYYNIYFYSPNEVRCNESICIRASADHVYTRLCWYVKLHIEQMKIEISDLLEKEIK